MIRGVFSVNGVGDDPVAEGSDGFVNEAIIDMLVIDGFRIIGVKCGGRIVAGAGIHIQKMFSHGGIAGGVRGHVEIAHNEGRVGGYFLAVSVNQFRAVHLALVSEAEMGVHEGEGLSAFLVPQNYIHAHPVAVEQCVPATGFHLRGVGKPEVACLDAVKLVLAPKDRCSLHIPGFAAGFEEQIVLLTVKFFDIGLPCRAVFLKADHIGSIPGRDGSKPGCPFGNGVAIGIIAEPDIEANNTEIHNQTAFRTVYGDYRAEMLDLQYISIDDLTDGIRGQVILPGQVSDGASGAESLADLFVSLLVVAAGTGGLAPLLFALGIGHIDGLAGYILLQFLQQPVWQDLLGIFILHGEILPWI